jgi:hypothetical protein
MSQNGGSSQVPTGLFVERAEMVAQYPQPYRLTFDDAVNIWLRHWNGEYQHQIAASYGVNQGRVNEVLKGHKYSLAKVLAGSKRSAA